MYKYIYAYIYIYIYIYIYFVWKSLAELKSLLVSKKNNKKKDLGVSGNLLLWGITSLLYKTWGLYGLQGTSPAFIS